MRVMFRKPTFGAVIHMVPPFVTTGMPCAEPDAKRTVPIVLVAAVSVKNTVRTDGQKTSNKIPTSARKKPPACIVWSIKGADVIWPMERDAAVIVL